MQNTKNRKGYRAMTLKVTGTAQTLAALIAAQIDANFFAGSYREVQFQVDPEQSDTSLSLRIGDGSLGTTINSVVQKGITLQGGLASDTYRVSGANAIYAQMMYLQAVSSDVLVNIQFLEE